MKKRVAITLIVATMLAINIATALTMDLIQDENPAIYSTKEIIKFNSLITIQDPDTQLPISNFTIKINGPTKDECTFLIDGTNSCSSFLINPVIVSSAYGFDNSSVVFDGKLYNFNETFGYGFNESLSQFNYEISWNSTNSSLGRHLAILSINTGNEIKPSISTFSSFKISSFDNPEITIISPNQTIFGKKQVQINIQSNKILEKIEISDNNERFQRICTKCSSFSRIMTFIDGNHKIIIKGTDEFNNIASEEFSFKVVSKPPIIHSYSPKKIANGIFEIGYTEENLKEITFYYKSTLETVYNSASLGFIDIDKCPSGKKQKCKFYVNVTDFPSPMEYFIVLSNEVLSSSTKPTKVTLDSSIPEITIISPQSNVSSKNLMINIQLTEKARLTYSLDNKLPRVICNNCNHAIKPLPLSLGNHEIILKSIDAAGNSDTKKIEILIQ